jgi:hypothetical protein
VVVVVGGTAAEVPAVAPARGRLEVRSDAADAADADVDVDVRDLCPAA